MKNENLSLKNTPLSNDWFFGRVMSDTELCRLFLEKVLHLKIRKVELVNAQQTIDPLQNSKGIRLDIYVADDENTIYNVEMQTKNKELPKRSRYYASCIDLDLVPKGTSYKKLTPTYIVFVCTFDLFGKGRHYYSFQNRCDQDSDVLLNDETHKVFLNTKGTLDDIDEDIKEFLIYIENTTNDIAQSCKSEFVKRVHEKVETIRNSQECEVEFMTYQERLREEREDGRELGKIETAEELLRLNVSIDIIMNATGFSRAKIEEIKSNLLTSV